VDDELRAIAKTAIGAEVGLSAAQSARLVGDSAEALRLDAKTMAKELGIAVDEPGRDERGRFRTVGDAVGNDMNRIIREASGR
jgi:hypothetical protein